MCPLMTLASVAYCSYLTAFFGQSPTLALKCAVCFLWAGCPAALLWGTSAARCRSTICSSRSTPTARHVKTTTRRTATRGVLDFAPVCACAASRAGLLAARGRPAPPFRERLGCGWSRSFSLRAAFFVGGLFGMAVWGVAGDFWGH